MSAELRDDYIKLAESYGYIPDFPTSVSETIQELEEAQADGRLSSVGRDMLKALKAASPDELRRTEALLEPTGYASFLDQVRSSGCISTSTLQQVFCAEFPTGDFNAWATRTPNGYLCLLNHGLRNLLFRTSMAIWSAYGDESRDKPSFKETLSYVVEICGMYLAGRKGPPSTDVLHTQFALKVGGQIAGAMRLFVVAHEVAHVELGHLENSIAESLPSQIGNVDVLTKSRGQEFDADRLAQEVLTAYAIRKAPNPDGSGGSLSIICGGVCFLTVEMIVARVRSKLFRRPALVAETHPSSEKRIEALYELLERIISVTQLKQLQLIHGAFVRIHDALDRLESRP